MSPRAVLAALTGRTTTDIEPEPDPIEQWPAELRGMPIADELAPTPEVTE